LKLKYYIYYFSTLQNKSCRWKRNRQWIWYSFQYKKKEKVWIFYIFIIHIYKIHFLKLYLRVY